MKVVKLMVFPDCTFKGIPYFMLLVKYMCAFLLKISSVPVGSAVPFEDRNCSDLSEAFLN